MCNKMRNLHKNLEYLMLLLRGSSRFLDNHAVSTLERYQHDFLDSYIHPSIHGNVIYRSSILTGDGPLLLLPPCNIDEFLLMMGGAGLRLRPREVGGSYKLSLPPSRS